jgi:hypothetical protein
MSSPIKAVGVPRSLLRQIVSGCSKKVAECDRKEKRLDPSWEMSLRSLSMRRSYYKGRGDFARELLMIGDAVEKGMKERGEK